MGWSNSKVFRQYTADMIGNTSALDYDADTIKVPTYNNTTVPDNTVTAANSAYAVGQWVVGNEVTSSTDLPTAGLTLASKTVTPSSGNVPIDAADTASGAAATATVYGNLTYDDTLTTPVADQGMCYNYYGGSVAVSNGTLTLVWNASGLANYAH